MSYSGVIAKLNSSVSKINDFSLEVSFSSAWEGKACEKQMEMIQNLNTALTSQLEEVEKLINALTSIDSFHTMKNEYNRYCSLLQGLDTEDANYGSYSRGKSQSYQDMMVYKEDAISTLNSISSSYSSCIEEISSTEAVATSLSFLPETLFTGVDFVETSSTASSTESKSWTSLSSTPSSSSTSRGSSGGTSSGGSSRSSGSSSSSGPYESSSAKENYVVEKIDMSNVPDAPEDTICAANMSLNVASDRDAITSKFSKQTQEIVSKHANDFNYSNFKSIIGGDEDFENYCKNVLGGVFAKWVGKNKTGEGKTASEFQEIAEYVFGLMVMYGFDYCNGDPGHYGKYGANNDAVASSAFYPSGVYNSPGKNDNTNGDNIDTICAGTQKDGVNMTTNCNYGMDYLYRKAGIFGKDGAPTSSCNVSSLLSYASKNGGGITTRVDELQVGDLIQCYNGSVSEADAMSGDANRWKKNGGWYHVCCVGEVEKNEAGETVAVVLYDAGHRFTNSGNFKYRVELNSSDTRKLGDYSDHWVGINLGTIAQDSFTKVVSA